MKKMNHYPLRDGVVHCEGVPLPLIAREVGTPVFVYSTAAMQERARGLIAALSTLDNALIAYAVRRTRMRR
jgi:diaminopimelate decarboxylase